MMFRRVLRHAPHPLREFFLIWLSLFVAACLLTLLHLGGALRPVTGLLGGAGVLLGLSIALNLRGAADFWATLITHSRPVGVDYSNSVFRRPMFVRLFFLAFAAVGVTFIIGSITGPVSRR